MGNSASTEKSSSPVRGVDALKAFISSVDSCPNSSARNEDEVSGDFFPVPNHSLNYEDAPLDTGYCGEVENPEDLNFMTLQASFLSSLLPIKNKASQDQTLYDVLRSQRFSLNCIEYVTMCASFILSALEMYGQYIPQDVAIINDRSYYMMHTLEKLQEFLSKMKFNHWNLEHILERESTCRNCDVKQILFRHVTLKNISKSSSFCLVCMLFLPKEEVVVHISSDGHKRLKENLQAEMYPHDCGKCPLRFCKQDDLRHHLSQHRSGSDVSCEKEGFNLFCCYLCKITLENKRDLREHMKTSIEHALKKEIAMEVNLRSKIASQHYSSDVSCATNVDSPLEVLHGVTNNLKVEQKSFQHHSSSIEAVVKNSSPEQIWIEIEQPRTTPSHKIKTGYKFPSPTQSISLSSLTKSNGLDSVPPSLESVDVAEEPDVNDHVKLVSHDEEIQNFPVSNFCVKQSYFSGTGYEVDTVIKTKCDKRNSAGAWILNSEDLDEVIPDEHKIEDAIIHEKVETHLTLCENFKTISKTFSFEPNGEKKNNQKEGEDCIPSPIPQTFETTLSHKIKTGYKFPSPTQSINLSSLTKSNGLDSVPPSLESVDVAEEPDVNNHVKLVSHDKEIQNFPVSNFCVKQSYFSGMGYEVDTKISGCFMDIEMVTDSAKTVPTIGPQLADVKNSLPAEQIWFEIKQPKKDECSSLKPSVMGGLSSDVTLHHIPSEYYCCTCQKKVAKANKIEHEKGKKHTELLQASEEASSKLSFEPNVIKTKCEKRRRRRRVKQSYFSGMGYEVDTKISGCFMDIEMVTDNAKTVQTIGPQLQVIEELILFDKSVLDCVDVSGSGARYRCSLCSSGFAENLYIQNDKIAIHLLSLKHLSNWSEIQSLHIMEEKLKLLIRLQSFNLLGKCCVKALSIMEALIKRRTETFINELPHELTSGFDVPKEVMIQSVNELSGNKIQNEVCNENEHVRKDDVLDPLISLDSSNSIPQNHILGYEHEEILETSISSERDCAERDIDVNEISQALNLTSSDTCSEQVMKKVLNLEQNFIHPVVSKKFKFCCSLCSIECHFVSMFFHLLSNKHLNEVWATNQTVEMMEEKLKVLISLQIDHMFQNCIPKAISRIEVLILQKKNKIEWKIKPSSEVLPEQELRADPMNVMNVGGCSSDNAERIGITSENEGISSSTSLRDVIVIEDSAAVSLQVKFLQACGGWDSDEFDVECGVCGALFPIYNGDIDLSLDMHAQNDPQHSLASSVPVERDAQKISETSKTKTLTKPKPQAKKSSACHKLVTKKTYTANNKKEVLKKILQLEDKYIAVQNNQYFCKLCSLTLNTDCSVVHHCFLPIHMSKKWATDHTAEMLKKKYEKIQSLLALNYADSVIKVALSRITLFISEQENPKVTNNSRRKRSSKTGDSKSVTVNSPPVESKVKGKSSLNKPSSSTQAKSFCETCRKNYSEMDKADKKKHRFLCLNDQLSLYFCDICKLLMASGNKVTHMKGKFHKKNMLG